MNQSVSAAPVVTVGSVTFGNDRPLSVIAGPCQMESRAHAIEVAGALKEMPVRLAGRHSERGGYRDDIAPPLTERLVERGKADVVADAEAQHAGRRLGYDHFVTRLVSVGFPPALS